MSSASMDLSGDPHPALTERSNLQTALLEHCLVRSSPHPCLCMYSGRPNFATSTDTDLSASRPESQPCSTGSVHDPQNGQLQLGK